MQRGAPFSLIEKGVPLWSRLAAFSSTANTLQRDTLFGQEVLRDVMRDVMTEVLVS